MSEFDKWYQHWRVYLEPAYRALETKEFARRAWELAQPQWQTIETIQFPEMKPDECTQWAATDSILLFDPEVGVAQEGFAEISQSYEDGAPIEHRYVVGDGNTLISATHWMPLPNPPADYRR